MLQLEIHMVFCYHLLYLLVVLFPESNLFLFQYLFYFDHIFLWPHYEVNEVLHILMWRHAVCSCELFLTIKLLGELIWPLSPAFVPKMCFLETEVEVLVFYDFWNSHKPHLFWKFHLNSWCRAEDIKVLSFNISYFHQFFKFVDIS